MEGQDKECGMNNEWGRYAPRWQWLVVSAWTLYLVSSGNRPIDRTCDGRVQAWIC